MTTAEFAEHIGVCERTVKNLLRQGLPSIEVGRARRIDVEKAILFLQSGGASRAKRTRAKRRAVA